ncbi:hypothetical protein AB0D54_34930 [Streptomyces xanthophaeus]|uniref:hypothetical protein n=1 Tax=Streptomyces xanthophaeus TaxID=67385 RepID=UPI00341DE6DD
MTAYPHDFEPVFAPLRGTRAIDVRRAGWLDHDQGWPRAVPLAGPVYLVVEDGAGATRWIRFESLGGHGQLGIRAVDRPGFPAVLDPEDDEFVLLSCGDQHLDEPQGVVGVRYLLNRESDLAAGTVRALEIEFEYGTRLLLDPGHHWGISLRGAGAHEKLRSSLEDPPSAHAPVEEHTWTA